MINEESVEISAPIEHVWATYLDVEQWPQWAESFTEVVVDGEGPLQVGTKVRIRQPKLPRVTWTVTELIPGASWTWANLSPGSTARATHVMTAINDQTTRVDTRLEQVGFIGHLVGVAYAKLTRRYMAAEAAGLKARCEAEPETDPHVEG